MRPLNRPWVTAATPPAAAYQTYEIRAPRSTHWRPATCAEVDCQPYLNGWSTRIPRGSDLIELIARSGRQYIETTALDGGEREFVFEAGQPCFRQAQHRLRVGRPELYVVRGGDWRGNPTGMHRRHTRAADWVEDFGEHQLRIADQREKG